MENVGGVFIVLIAGSIFAFLYGIFEWIVDVKTRAKSLKVGYVVPFVYFCLFFFWFSMDLETINSQINL